MTRKFQSGVDLPWGPYGERFTYYDDSFVFLTIDISEPEVIESTESEWPTVIIGEQNGTKVGIAIVHVTQLNEKPIEEIDIFVDSHQDWWVLVEFADLDAALSGGRYGIQGYNGYEIIPCKQRLEGFDLFTSYADKKETPIFKMDDDTAAFAIQRSPNFGTLHSMFKFDTYSNIKERQQSLERQVLSRDEWLKKNSLTGIAQDLTEDN